MSSGRLAEFGPVILINLPLELVRTLKEFTTVSIRADLTFFS